MTRGEKRPENQALLSQAPMADPTPTLQNAPPDSGAPALDPLIGRKLGDFQVLEKLGQGGLGAVYRVSQTTLGREAVIKVLHPRNRENQDIGQRFLRESRLASKLDHPYAAHIYAFGAESDGLLWIAMELVRGITLDQMLQTQGPLPLARLSQLLDRMAEVVDSAHEQGIVHRDIKPSNVMVISRAGRILPKLLDFGLAKFVMDESDAGFIPPAETAATAPPEPFLATPVSAPWTTPSGPTRDLHDLLPPQLPPPAPVAVYEPLTARAEVTRFVDTRPRRIAPLANAADKDTREVNIPAPSLDKETPFLINLRPSHTPSPVPENKSPGLSRLTPADRPVGTPHYMAPEQWLSGEVDARSDIYALGVLCFECLTGKVPFNGATHRELRQKHLEEPVPSLGPGQSNLLHAVLAKAMSKRVDQRYVSALEFAADLRLAAGLNEEPLQLPHLDERIREAMVLQAPQPLAESVAALEAARNERAAAEAARELFNGLAQLLGILALAARARVGPGEATESQAVKDAFQKLHREELLPLQWFELAKGLCRPFCRKRDAHPLPELVSLFFEPPQENPTGTLALAEDIAQRLAAPPSEGRALKDWLRLLLPQLSRLLTSVSFLMDYPWVALRDDVAEEWTGLRRPHRTALRVNGTLREGEPTLVTRDGVPVLRLQPFVQRLSPTPGVPEELFCFAGHGRLGARLVAAPLGFERFDDTLWSWFAAHIADLDLLDPTAAREDHPPYRGLNSFSQADAANYFGREREAEAFANRLRQHTFLAVVGPSGVGKSSFVQAGVLPLLPAGFGSVVLRPGPAPLVTLAARLGALGFDTSQLRERLGRSPAALGELLRAKLGDGGFVLVVDQFEELLTLCHDSAERELYAAALAQVSRHPGDHVRVVVTLRDDFLIRAQRLTPLREKLGPGLQLLSTPAVEDLVRTLTEPAARRGYVFEDDALPRQMASEVSEQPGALAILSFTASKLWEVRDRQLKQMTRKAYQALGGVGGALAQHAEATLAQMSPEAQRLTREAFRHLVSHEGTRAVLTRAETQQVLGGGAAAESMLETLISARILVSSEGEGDDDRLEVVHEALLSSWPRLVQWQRADAENARMRDQLRAAARQWEEKKRPRGVLWRGEALTEYRLWRSRYKGALTQSEEAFASQSLKEEARGRKLRNTALFSVMALLFVGLVVLYGANEKTRHANQQAQNNLRLLHLEQGRTAFLASKPLQAVVYLSRAYDEGLHGAGLKYMLGKSMGLIRAHLKSFRGHTQRVSSAAFSPNSTRVVTASSDGTARVWDVENGASVLTLHHPHGVNSAEFSPDGARVVTTGVDNARVWDATSGAQQLQLLGHHGNVADARFTQRGDAIITASQDGTLKVWDGTTGALRRTLEDGTGWLGHIEFSPDGRWVVGFTGSHDGSGTQRPVIWNWETGEQIARLPGGKTQVKWGSFSPDGRWLATAGEDNAVQIWETRSWRAVQRLEGHWAAVNVVAWRPDSRQLASGSDDKTICLWNIESGKLAAILPGHDGAVRALTYTTDGQSVVTAGDDATARVWDVASRKQVMTYFGHGKSIHSIALSQSGSRILTSSFDETAMLWDAHAKLTRARWTDPRGNTWARFGHDSSRFMTNSGDDKTVTIWNTFTGEKLDSIQLDQQSLAFPGFSRTGDLLATSDEDDPFDVEVYALPSRKLRWRFHGHDAKVNYLDFSPSDSQLVTSSDDGTARVWDLGSGKMSLVLKHPGAVNVGVFDPSGKTLLTGDSSGTVTTWDAVTGRALHVFAGHASGVFSAAFSPRGGIAATGSTDQTARLWDTRSGQVISSLAHSAYVASVSFNPNGDLLLTGSYDGSAKIWEVETGSLIDNFEFGETVDASFSPDGNLLGAAGIHGALSIWNLDFPVTSPAEVAAFVNCRVPLALQENRLISVRAASRPCAP